MKENGSHSIVFFDGVCNLCNGFIDFLIRHDLQAHFKVASLQGETAHSLLPQQYLKELSTVVLLVDGEIKTKADAAISVLITLNPMWKVLVFIPFKNYFYDVIARNRYRLFGRRETCRLPTEAEHARFLP